MPLSSATDGGKDVTVTKDEFLREQMERTEQQRTRRRRDDRSRRRRVYIFVGFGLVLLMILAAPTLISNSSFGRSMLHSAAAEYGLDATASSLKVGWVTPLRITGLQVRGASGATELSVDRIDTELTVTGFLGSPQHDLGEIVLRDVNLRCEMAEGRSSLEDDLAKLLESPGDGAAMTAAIKLQDITVAVTDSVTGDVWQVAQSNADVSLAGPSLQASFAGVLNDPAGAAGSIQGQAELDDQKWLLDLESESLPMSVVSLVRRRMPELAASIPARIGGDATGGMRVTGTPDGNIEASLRSFEIRNLTAGDHEVMGPQQNGMGQNHPLWANRLATVDGELEISEKRIIGRGLRATTDFAAATVDGAFSRTFSFVGSHDNPLRWLDGLDGSLTAEIDLALLDQALPGLLPLKHGARLVSGRALAKLDSLPANGDGRRSQLLIQSDALRANSGGVSVLIDPIRLNAIVSSNGGQLTAEQFEWTSTFAKAVGQGDLRSGSANVEIDFGRLSGMLRPIVDLSKVSLGGSANGDIRWNASPDNVWRLGGSGSATNLEITLPSGETFRRPSMRSDIEAVGRWGGQSLEELTQASVTLSGTGFRFGADLVQPVANPSAKSPLPIRIQGDGRVETLAETLSPWLPEQIRDAEGGFTLNARGDVSTIAQSIRSAAIELKTPRVAYGGRHFSQPQLKILFNGDASWPAGSLRADSLTIASDAFSAAVRGVANSENVDLQVHWRANLERVQGSVRKQIATGPTPIQQVGYRPGQAVQATEWLLMGDCEGDLGIVTRGNVVELNTLVTAKQFAVVQPAAAGASFQTVGPMPSRRGGANGSAGRVVWSEPNLRVDGLLQVDRTTGQVRSESVKVAGDWFATDLGGQAIWNESTGGALLEGPARIKMDKVAALLTNLSGTEINAIGIQQTPLKIQANRGPDGNLAFLVEGNLGWESGDIAGVSFGPASIPVRLTETTVTVSPSVVPVGQGQVNLAGAVHYRPGPLWLQVNPGVVAQSIRFTPEMTKRWLKYMAPLVADAANIDGSFSAEIDEAIVVFDNPQQSSVTGRLKIAGAQMTAGPLASQIVNGIEQLKAIARVAAGPTAPAGNRTLINMPPQTVEFIVDSGVVNHKTLFFEVDRAQVVTSGNVNFDGRLNMVAQVPLDARWLGRDLQGLAGQPVTLPIDGTLSRPSLDSRGVRQVVSQLGVQAAQSATENYLQQQLNRGFDKIFGGK